MDGGALVRDVGPLYTMVVVSVSAWGWPPRPCSWSRRLFFKSVIYKLQTVVVVAGLTFGYVVSFAFAIILPSASAPRGIRLMPVAAPSCRDPRIRMTITRLFDLAPPRGPWPLLPVRPHPRLDLSLLFAVFRYRSEGRALWRLSAPRSYTSARPAVRLHARPIPETAPDRASYGERLRRPAPSTFPRAATRSSRIS
jgi:hypothetical protein